MERWHFPSVHRRYIHLALCSGSEVSQQMFVHQQHVIIWFQKIQNTNYIACMQNMEEAKTITWPDTVCMKYGWAIFVLNN